MPSKIAIPQVADLLKKHQIDPATLRELVQEMNELVAPAADQDIAPPAPKKQYVFLLSDPTGLIRQRIDANNLVGWVLQIPENASPHSTTDRIFRGAYDYNASKKGRHLPVHSVGESLECVGPRYFKEAELWVKTRMPVAVLVTDNVLPRDESAAATEPTELERHTAPA